MKVNIIDSISKNIFSKNEDTAKLDDKLMSIYFILKKLYREPYTWAKEEILRESPKETLEYLLNRGIIEKHPSIELYINFNEKGIPLGWRRFIEIRDKFEQKILTMKDLCITKVNFFYTFERSWRLSRFRICEFRRRL